MVVAGSYRRLINGGGQQDVGCLPWLLRVVNFQFAPGATFTLQAPPQPGWDGNVSCRFLEIEEPRRLSYRWIVGDIDTIVTFTLMPTATGTRLSLVQSGFKAGQKKNIGGARYGWRLMGGRLVGLLAEIPDRPLGLG